LARTRWLASVSLNIFIMGQATGSAIGDLPYAHGLLRGIDCASIGFVALALAMVIATRRTASA
jgi:hypothetical protein